MAKVKFQGKPDAYNHFLDIRKDFKSQVIGGPVVINSVSGLFNGHTTLIQGFNTFLPQGYRIDCTVDQLDHNLITVTTPSGTTTQTAGGPPRHILSSHASPAPFAAPTHPSLPGGPLPPLSPFYNGNSLVTAHAIAASTPGLSHSDAGPSTKGGPMIEFNQAVNYVNKIKQRFASDPDTYKQFLEILQTYQKEQRPIAEVYQQVNVLFNNQRDLLEDFQHFLPDDGAGGGGGSAGMGGVGFSGNGGLFGMMAQMAAEGSWGRVDDKGGKGKEPGGSGGVGSKAGGSGDKDKRKDGKERE
ncbi:Transcriptional regulatory protein sin3 [Ceratobasidium sp. UAMH 11750]|nr:Transcriptional regulatory protein sin3 [Ceratobasidium sp. UAMH 11750]